MGIESDRVSRRYGEISHLTKPWRVVMRIIVAATELDAVFSVNRHDLPTSRIGSALTLVESVGWPETPIIPTGPPEDIRKAELSRRAVRPVGDPKRENGRNYEDVLNGGETRPYPRAAAPMPLTFCRFVETVPKTEDRTSGPHGVHRSTVHLFENMSGFGYWRMMWFKNNRGVDVASRDIDRVELVSLLTDEEPSVYVLNELATPPAYSALASAFANLSARSSISFCETFLFQQASWFNCSPAARFAHRPT